MAKDDEWDWGVDYFDTRDLVERIAYIQNELETDADFRDQEQPQEYLSDDERETLVEELRQLQEFAGELEGYAGDSLRDGNTVIADDHFEEYAQEYAGDLHGSAIVDASWPFDHIDWSEAAEGLKMDYSEVTDPDGNGWWVR